MTAKEIFSEKVAKGKRTYFFDINKSGKGDFYIKISERRKTENGFEHDRIMVFEEDIKDFIEAFKITLSKLKELKNPKQLEDKAYSVEKIRETHKNAYLPWTAKDDHKLELLFCEGKKVKELAKIFGRKDGAILARIKKLELKEKYGE
jgi:hypothetical protein